MTIYRRWNTHLLSNDLKLLFWRGQSTVHKISLKDAIANAKRRLQTLSNIQIHQTNSSLSLVIIYSSHCRWMADPNSGGAEHVRAIPFEGR